MDRPMLPNRIRTKITRHVNRILMRLLDHQVLKGVYAELTEHELMDMCLLLPELFSAETALISLKVDEPIMVVGDIHGQYGHLVRILNRFGHPPNQRYLFLGNYINQGPRSIETISLLFAYKVKYPKDIYLLRGKHECERLAQVYGFYEECCKRYSRRLWNSIVQVFRFMPCSAIIDDRVFCVHSGLSPMFSFFDVRGLKNLKRFIRKSINLPSDVGSNRLLTHFIWSDSDPTIAQWDQNPAGLGYLYGAEVVDDFCKRFNLLQVVRSSEMQQNGFEFFQSSKLLTIFSAPDYMDTYSNDAALLFLFRLMKDTDIRGYLNIASPIIRLRCRQTLRMNMNLSTIPIELGYGELDDPSEKDEKPSLLPRLKAKNNP